MGLTTGEGWLLSSKATASSEYGGIATINQMLTGTADVSEQASHSQVSLCILKLGNLAVPVSISNIDA